MNSCNIQRTPSGIKVFIEGSKSVESQLYSNILQAVKGEFDFVQARHTWLKDLIESKAIVPSNPEAPFESQNFDPEEVALKIYLFMTRQPDMKEFMKNSPYVDVYGEPILTLSNGARYAKSKNGRRKTIVPARQPKGTVNFSGSVIFNTDNSRATKTSLREYLSGASSSTPTAKVLQRLAKSINVDIELYPSREAAVASRAYVPTDASQAFYDPNTNVIVLTPSEIRSSDMERVILHEVLHAVTFRELTDRPDSEYSSKINELFKLAKSRAKNPNQYGFTNEHEFVSEAFSNPVFQTALSLIETEDRSISILDRFVALVMDILRSILGLDISSGSVLYKVVDATLKYASTEYETLSRNRKDSQWMPSRLEEVLFFEPEQRKDLKDMLSTRKVNDYDYKPLFDKLSQDITLRDEVYYVGNSPISRLTDWISKTFSNDTIKEPKALAEALFKTQGQPEDGVVSIKSGEIKLTKAEAEEYFRVKRELIAELGRIKHRYIEYLTTDERSKLALEKELRDRIEIWQQIANQPKIKLPKNGYEDISSEPLHKWSELKYIEKDINYILAKAGVKRFIKKKKDDYSPIGKDEEDRLVVHEQKLYSPLLGIATTADMIVVHNDNSITIADWKTGDLLSDFQFNKILKYADELAIKDSKLSKAKFEIFIRALIIKELAPETKFRNLLVTQLNPYAVESYEVEVEEYLNLYTRYLTRENPELLAKLKEKGLLTLSSYIGSSDTLDRKFKELNDKATTRDEKINYVMQKIRSYGYTQSLASLRNSIDYGTSKAFKEWGFVLLELVKDSGKQLNPNVDDESSFWAPFKNLSDIAHPLVQTLHEKVILKAQRAFSEENYKYEAEHDRLLKAVLEEGIKYHNAYRAPIAVVNAIKAIAFVGSFSNPLSLTAGAYAVGKVLNTLDISNEDMYGWMIKVDGEGEYLNMDDYWYDAKRGERVQLTDAQRAYRDFYARSLQKVWEESMSAKIEQNLGTNFSSEITKAQFYGMSLELPNGFFPRIPLTEADSDIKLSDNPISNFALEIIDNAKRSIRNNLADYADPDFQDHGRDSALIAVKFHSHPGDGKAADRKRDGHRTYSHDMGAAFKMFTRNQLRKKHFDDAFVIGMAAHNILKFKKSSKANPEQKNLAEFLEKQILMHTLDEYDRDNFLHRPLTYKLGRTGAKVWGLPEDTTITLSAYKMLRLLMRHTSFITMSFKPMLFAFNFTMIQAQNLSRAISGSIIKSLGNVPPEYVNADISGYFATVKDYGKYVKDGLSGNLANNKAWILARKWAWLADASEHGKSFDTVLDYRNLLGLNSLGYMFSRVSETEGSIWHMISLLKSFKWKFEDGRTVSFWDLYDDKGEYIGGSRGKVDVGYGNTQELYGLDEREIKNLKRINEQLQGSYRKEERISLEYTLMGNMLLQFRRYLPTMLKNNLRSPYADSTQGFYKKREGEDTYEWNARMAYGRWRLILNYLHLDPRKTASRWKTDPVAFREELVHAITALSMSLGTGFMTEDIFPQGSSLDKRMGYLTQSLSQGISPNDVLTDLYRSPLPAVSTLKNFSQYGWEYLWDGIIRGKETQDGQLRGERGFIRSLPFLGSWQQMQQYIEDSAGVSLDRR